MIAIRLEWAGLGGGGVAHFGWISAIRSKSEESSQCCHFVRAERTYFRKHFFHLNKEGSISFVCSALYLIFSCFCAAYRSTLLFESAETAVASVTTSWLLWSIFMFSISSLPCSPFPLWERHTFCLKSSPILRRRGLITADATLCPQFHFSPGGA